MNTRYENTRPIALVLFELENGNVPYNVVVKQQIVKSLPIQTPIEQDLKNKNGQIVVSSRDVAVRFGKEHYNVIRDIESLTKSVDLKIEGYFIPSSYKASNGKTNPEYLLTRDGFTLLAMGFTGKEALKFKLQYIEAFNKMEEALKAQPQTPVLPTTYKDALMALVAEVEAKEKLQLENKQLDETIKTMKPKTEFCEDVLEADGAVSVSVIAKDYGVSAIEMNDNLNPPARLGRIE